MLRVSNFWQLFKQWARLLRKQASRPFRAGGEGAVCMEARLSAIHFDPHGRVIKDHGIVCTKVVTDAFVAFLVDQLQAETSEFGDFKFHDSGTSSTAEAQTQTDLIVKVETGRATGSQAEGASANIYKTIGTITYTATRAIVEHAVFSIAAAGTMLDRSVFSAINVDADDSIQFTYELTFPANG